MVDRLVARLGHNVWRTRERAQRSLERLGLSAEPALRRALASPDLEIRRRAQSVLDRLHPPKPKPRQLTPQELLQEKIRIRLRLGGQRIIIPHPRLGGPRIIIPHPRIIRPGGLGPAELKRIQKVIEELRRVQQQRLKQK